MSDRRACPFDRCDGSGLLVDEATRTTTYCACREQIVVERRTQAVRHSVPRRYRNLSFDRPPVTEIARAQPEAAGLVRHYIRHVDERLDAGDGLWLFGPKGTGKTTLAFLVAQEAVRRGRAVLTYNTVDLLNLIRSTYAPESRLTTAEVIERLVEVELLHLEDMAVARPTEWVLEQLYLIVNTRYEEERAIVFTSDQRETEDGELSTPAELGERVGERTLSRLWQMCGEPIALRGSDYRLALPDPVASTRST